MVAPIHHSRPRLRAEIIDPLSGDCWDREVMPLQQHTVFHRSAWARVLAETYGHQPHYLRVFISERKAALVPLMEVNSPFTGRRGVSLPFSDFAGPLWTGDRFPEIYDVLRNLTAEMKWRYLEIRGDATPAAGAGAFRIYAAHELDLAPGIPWLVRHLPAATRRSIHKAERSVITVSVEHGYDAMQDFYGLHGRTRRRHGLPPQPKKFFHAIGRHLIDAGLGNLVVARIAGKAIAGAVFLHSGYRAIYKFGASDPAYWSFRPNHLVMWHAIQHLAGMGCTSLHFGRTSCDNAGLIHFKHSWGCTGEVLRYFRFRRDTMAWIEDRRQLSESHPFPFRHLPLALNSFAGRVIYPHLD